MKVLLSWLREFAAIDAPVERIGHDLSMLGMAVEEEVLLGRGLDGIVVAKVLELRQHPDAKKIQRVVVDAGGSDPVEVWCGAFNMAVGDLVPLATVGTVMPDGMEISRRKILGEYSNGMLCSPRELQLADDAAGILLLNDQPAEPGTPIKEALGIVEDVLWDLEINPNRPDAMSVAGVARDLAAKYDEPFALPSPSVVRGGAPTSDAMVRGEISIGVLLYNIAYIKKRDGAPVEIIFPSEGVPLNYYAAGVTKTAANPNAAKLFLNWCMSDEGQSFHIKELGYLTALKNPPFNPPGYDPKVIKAWSPKFEEYVKLRDGWIEEWNKTYGYRQ